MAYEAELSRYDNLYKEYEKKNKEDAEKKRARTAEDFNEKLKQAYISRMQDQKSLNENMARVGIRGGATETSNLKLATKYQTTRNDLNKDKTRALEDVDIQANDNLFNYKQNNDSAKLSYTEQRESEERQLAQNAKEKEEAAQLDLLQAKYGSYYSIPSLNTAYNNAKTTQEKAIIQARIAYLNAHNKGY